MEVGIYFGSAPFTPLLHARELPDFSTLMAFDRSHWPRCLLWHGWLPGLVVAGERDPWATSCWDLACCELERRLGAYPGDTSAFFWTPPEHWDADDIASEMSDTPNIWTDGSTRDFSSLGGIEVAGAGVHVPVSELAFECSVWGTAEEYGDARLERCGALMPVPGPLQTVQRAEYSGVPSLLCSPTGLVIKVLTQRKMCWFCGERDGDGQLFWECTFHPLLHVRELPEMAFDRGNWPRCLSWHGWLPGLSCAGERDPWASSFGIKLAVSWRIVWVLILGMLLHFGFHLRIGMLMILLQKRLMFLIFGRMVVGRTSPLSVGLR